MRKVLVFLVALAAAIGLSFAVSAPASAMCIANPIGTGCLHLCPRSLNCVE